MGREVKWRKHSPNSLVVLLPWFGSELPEKIRVEDFLVIEHLVRVLENGLLQEVGAKTESSHSRALTGRAQGQSIKIDSLLVGHPCRVGEPF